ncbi:MAG: hypothetical protein IRZ07_13045 [Microbispora sp.]|nr:hypothetical protein [Microbispora sp.]
MPDVPFSPEEAARFAEMTEDELFTQLVPESERQDLFSFDGLVARGKQIFASRISLVRSLICEAYNSRPAVSDHSVDMVVLIATAIAGSPAVLNIPVLAFAALAVKIGLAELCRGGAETR